MKLLKKKDLPKVHPKFRRTVRTALENGEDVPYGVIYLTVGELNKNDIEWANKLIKEGY